MTVTTVTNRYFSHTVTPHQAVTTVTSPYKGGNAVTRGLCHEAEQ